jgi:NAD(P)-dependent dehydrogenase (short-subunit alcohol dehydrogenase family)
MPDDGRFAGRVALVTGGGRGIGRAIALALAAEGARVAVVARTSSQCESVAGEIGADALALTADVSDPAACAAAARVAREALGPPGLLVNAAGVSPVYARAEEHDDDAFRRILEVNLLGAHHMTRALAPALLEGGGAVLMVSSVEGVAASPRLAGYGASKAGMIQLTRTLGREWAPRGVRVNAICPAYVETEMTAAFLAVDRLRQGVLARTPMGRLGTRDEVVAPALFLLSDEASYITGAALLVDGGMAA